VRPDQPDMNLPAGYTCGDCRFHYHCKALFGCPHTNDNCDWSPSRFSLKFSECVAKLKQE
jgi:hypothetical protein